MKTVVGMFAHVREARSTFDDLVRLGFPPNEISILTRSPGATEAAGGDGGVMRFGSVDAPDAGRVAARGPLATTLARSGGGLVRTLEDVGVSHTRAEHFTAAVRQGETLESIIVEDRDADRVVEVMKRRAARFAPEEQSGERTKERVAERVEEAKTTAGAKIAAAAAGVSAAVAPAKEAIAEKLGRGDGRTASRPAEDVTIPVLRERIQIGKREVQRGAVHVGVRVVERPISEHIRLREEHIDIERTPTDRAPKPEEAGFRGGTLDISEYGEDPVVSKEIRVVEEVRLHKTITERDEVIQDTLRSTELDIDETAGEREAYRTHFASLGGGGRFEEHLPAYELGGSLRRSRSEKWEDVEPEARRRWEASRPGTWETYKERIRYAWSRARLR